MERPWHAPRLCSMAQNWVKLKQPPVTTQGNVDSHVATADEALPTPSFTVNALLSTSALES